MRVYRAACHYVSFAEPRAQPFQAASNPNLGTGVTDVPYDLCSVLQQVASRKFSVIVWRFDMNGLSVACFHGQEFSAKYWASIITPMFLVFGTGVTYLATKVLRSQRASLGGGSKGCTLTGDWLAKVPCFRNSKSSSAICRRLPRQMLSGHIQRAVVCRFTFWISFIWFLYGLVTAGTASTNGILGWSSKMVGGFGF